LDLSGSKPFDEFHLSVAVRTLPEGQVTGLAWCSLCNGGWHAAPMPIKSASRNLPHRLDGFRPLPRET
jgi:hypothetical protein